MKSELKTLFIFSALFLGCEPKETVSQERICSAWIELSQSSENNRRKIFLDATETMLRNLYFSAYRVNQGEKNNFILMNNFGSKPYRNEVDVPIYCANYYYIEPLLRFNKLPETGKVVS